MAIINKPNFFTLNTNIYKIGNLNKPQLYTKISLTENINTKSQTTIQTDYFKQDTRPFAPPVYQSSAALLHSLLHPSYEFIHSNDSDSSMDNDRDS